MTFKLICCKRHLYLGSEEFGYNDWKWLHIDIWFRIIGIWWASWKLRDSVRCLTLTQRKIDFVLYLTFIPKLHQIKYCSFFYSFCCYFFLGISSGREEEITTRHTNPQTESLIKIQNVELVGTKHFKYVGVWTSYDKLSKQDKEIKNRKLG